MNSECPECRVIALEMRAGLAELLGRRVRPRLNVSRQDVREALNKLFASDEGWERLEQLEQEFQSSKAGQAHARIMAHRMVSGHTAFLFDALGPSNLD